MNRLFIGVSGLIALIIVILLGWFFLRPTKLVITSSSNSSISVNETIKGADAAAKGFPKQGKKSLSLSLKPAEYTITATDSDGATASRRVTLRSHETLRLTLVPTSAAVMRKLATGDAHSLVAPDSNHLSYIEGASGNLFELSGGLATLVLTNAHLKSIAWSNSSFGVGQNTSGQLVTISSGKELPFNPQPGSQPVQLAASSTNYALSIGNDIYLGSSSISLHKAFSSKSPPAVLAVSSGVVAVVNNSDSGGDEASVITLIAADGKSVQKTGGSFVAALSPSGQKLVVSSSAGAEVLDASLKSVATISNNGMQNPVWINENLLLYSENDKLWLYSLSDERSSLLAKTPDGGVINELVISADKAAAYLVDRPSLGSDKPSIEEVSLPR